MVNTTNWKRKCILIVAAVIFMSSLLFMLYFSLFDYANADDWRYGANAFHALQRGEGIIGVIRAACENVVKYWYSWQGTWSSMFLFSIQPGIWGEHFYICTAWIMLLFLCGGITVFMQEELRSEVHVTKATTWTIILMTGFVTLQYMPKIDYGIYWWVGGAHYTIPYGICLLVVTSAIKYVKHASKWRYLAVLIGMTYLGGAGYPPMVICALWLLFIIVDSHIGFLASQYDESAKRGRRLIIPFIAEMLGFAVSAIAPGNKARGGSDFGFSFIRVIRTITTSITEGTSQLIGRLVTVKVLIPILLIVFILVWTDQKGKESKPSRCGWKEIIPLVLAFITCWVVRMPEIYAGIAVSGGVPDTYYFIDIMVWVMIVAQCSNIASHVFVSQDRNGRAGAVIKNIAIAAAVLTFLVNAKAIVKDSVAYMEYQYLSSGQLADYVVQMEERLLLLSDDSEDVIVPEMNPEQGPYLHLPLMLDPTEWTNEDAESFYGKKSIIAIPRDEYNAYINQ